MIDYLPIINRVDFGPAALSIIAMAASIAVVLAAVTGASHLLTFIDEDSRDIETDDDEEHDEDEY